MYICAPVYVNMSTDAACLNIKKQTGSIFCSTVCLMGRACGS